MQIHRGLEMLRPTLPAGLATGLLAAVLPTRGLAAVRDAVVRGARASLLVSASAGIVLMKKILAVACLLVAFAAVWFAAPGRVESGPGQPEQPSSPAAAAVGANHAGPSGTAAPTSRTSPIESRRAVASQPDEKSSTAPGSVLVQVIFEDTGEPASAVGVTVTPLHVDHALNALCRVTAATGVAVVDEVEPGRVRVELDRGPKTEVGVEPGRQTIVPLKVAAGADVDGIVVDQDEQSVSGAEVWLYPSGSQVYDSNERGQRVATSDGEGRFRLRALQSRQWVGARSHGHAPSPVLYIVPAPRGGDVKVRLQLAGAGCSLKGRVIGTGDRPVSGALVAVVPPRANPRRKPNGGFQQESVPVFLRSDAQGCFFAQGLAPGSVRVLVSATRYGPRDLDVRLDPAGTPELEVRLETGASLSGRVTDSTSRPVAGAPVSAGGTEWRHERTVLSRSDGTFTFEGLPPGRIRASCYADEFVPQAKDFFVEGSAPLVWDVVLEPLARLRGRVVDAAERGLVGFVVEARLTTDPHGRYVKANADGQGRFEMGVLPGAKYRLHVREPGQWLAFDAEDVGEVTGGGDEVVIKVPDRHSATAWIEGTVLDKKGQPIGGAFLQLADGKRIDHRDRQQSSFESGALRVGPLIPGRYRLVLHAPENPTVNLGEHELSIHQVLDLGKIQITGAGRLVLSLWRTDRKRLEEFTASLENAIDKSDRSVIAVGDDGIGTTALMPGTYRFEVFGDNFMATSRMVTIVEDREEKLDVELEPARRRMVVYHGEGSEDWKRGTKVSIVIRRENGAEIVRHESPMRPGARPRFLPVLPAGTCTLEATINTGARFVGSFRLTDLAPSNEPIVVELSPAR